MQSKPADINDPGKPGSLQRLLYSTPRVGYGYGWKQINDLAQKLLEEVQPKDTEYSLLLNALCCALEEITQ